MTGTVIWSAWPELRLRFLLRGQRTSEQLQRLQRASQVSFIPMEAVGEYGGLKLDLIRDKESVEHGYTLFFDGDVVVAKITPCFENGKGALASGLYGGIAYGTTELHVLSPVPQLDERFLFYLTMSHAFRNQGEAAMKGAAGQKRVTDEFIQNFRFRVPPIVLQRRIADYLDAETARIDRLIAEKQRLLELLAEKRQAVITRAVTRGIVPNVPLRDSGIAWLGKIPEHWGVERLKFHLRTIEQGWSPQCDNYPADLDEWGVLKVGSVNGWEFNPNENKRLPDDIQVLPEYEILEGDVLISRANTTQLLGSISLVRNVRPKLLLCDKLYRLILNNSRLDCSYLVLYLRSTSGRFEFERDASGASNSMQNIGQDSVRNVWIPIPPLNEQCIIASYIFNTVKYLDSLRDETIQTVELLKERRSALITAAVTGQLEPEAMTA